MVKDPPSNAGDTGSIPGRGTKIPHAGEQQSFHATITEGTHLNKRAGMSQLEKENSHATTREKPTHHN